MNNQTNGLTHLDKIEQLDLEYEDLEVQLILKQEGLSQAVSEEQKARDEQEEVKRQLRNGKLEGEITAIETATTVVQTRTKRIKFNTEKLRKALKK